MFRSYNLCCILFAQHVSWTHVNLFRNTLAMTYSDVCAASLSWKLEMSPTMNLKLVAYEFECFSFFFSQALESCWAGQDCLKIEGEKSKSINCNETFFRHSLSWFKVKHEFCLIHRKVFALMKHLCETSFFCIIIAIILWNCPAWFTLVVVLPLLPMFVQRFSYQKWCMWRCASLGFAFNRTEKNRVQIGQLLLLPDTPVKWSENRLKIMTTTTTTTTTRGKEKLRLAKLWCVICAFCGCCTGDDAKLKFMIHSRWLKCHENFQRDKIFE